MYMRASLCVCAHNHMRIVNRSADREQPQPPPPHRNPPGPSPRPSSGNSSIISFQPDSGAVDGGGPACVARVHYYVTIFARTPNRSAPGRKQRVAEKRTNSIIEKPHVRVRRHARTHCSAACRAHASTDMQINVPGPRFVMEKRTAPAAK